ncbi:endonuclease/exonuclease/phosphatase family protein [Pantanalinema rosaneae CENA516]|uniref:endonuclease/exonuclease/phosphatase family protein n=1 Tax=Pantanalinema rosaneae TaxID=1620701 RepID=UPI003D6E79ED
MTRRVNWRDRWQDWLGTVIKVSLLVVLLCSLTGYLGNYHQLLDLTAHFKGQYLLVGLVALIYFCLRWRSRWRWMIVSLVCIGLNAAEILPWYFPAASVHESTPSLRVLLSNVKVQNRQYDRVIALVREVQPDIAVFQEVNQVWLDQLDILRDQLPYRVSDSEATRFGNVIYSALPLQQVSSRRFAQERFPSLLAEIQPERDRPPIALIATHPSPPLKPADFAARNQQFTAMADYIQKVSDPVMVIGDLNTTMWSPNYRKFVQQTRLRNSRVGFGILPTWPAQLPLLTIPIDHCLVSPEITVIQTQTGKNIGSDHLPLIVDLL